MGRIKDIKMIQNQLRRAFSSMQTKVAIIGAGPSGHSLSA